jgi:tRNA/tmRNA/rRNA uracil-C5-methylase (TrmA/RlmC/RlmD family)
MMDGDKPRSVTEIVAGHPFQLNTDVFWQVHVNAAEQLSAAVLSAIDWKLWDEGAPNHDLYGGVGLFAVALANKGGKTSRLVSVELDKQASTFCQQNLAGLDSASSVTSDVMAYLRHQLRALGSARRTSYRSATVVLDPPRSGAGQNVIGSLVALAPKQLVYVACDPVAFARDQKLLAGAGYVLRHLAAFDLFPHTHHIEMVAGFQADS